MSLAESCFTSIWYFKATMPVSSGTMTWFLPAVESGYYLLWYMNINVGIPSNIILWRIFSTLFKLDMIRVGSTHFIEMAGRLCQKEVSDVLECKFNDTIKSEKFSMMPKTENIHNASEDMVWKLVEVLFPYYDM